MKKPIFISLLEYGEEVGLNGTDITSVHNWAIKNKIVPPKHSPGYKKSEGLLTALFWESFEKNETTTENIWVLKNEYYFRLLEYRELNEARRAAKQANRNAWIAIGIATIAVIVGLVIPFIPINNPVSLNKEQFNRLTKSINDSVSASIFAGQSQTESVIKAIKNSFNNSVTIDEKQFNEIVKAIKGSNKSLKTTPQSNAP